MQIETLKKFGLSERKEMYEQILKIFRNKIRLFVCLRDKKPISAALCFYTPTMAYLSLAPYYTESEDFLTNTLPICASIRYACDEGYQYFDLGITQTPELAFHKDKFCGKQMPLMIYKKKFSYSKLVINRTFSTAMQFGKKYIRRG